MKFISLAVIEWIFLLISHSVNSNTTVITADFLIRDVDLQIGESTNLTLVLSGKLEAPITVYFTYQEADKPMDHQERKLVEDLPNIIFDQLNVSSQERFIIVKGIDAGNVYLGINSSDPLFINKVSHYCKVSISHFHWMVILAAVTGWAYFVAWTISFYPQIFLNCKRKSVVGLNFDFVAYNLLGYIAYSFFNVGLYWIPSIKDEYMQENPRGVNPVQLNDVIFSLHGAAITIFIIIQCIVFERNGQRVSWLGVGIISILLLFIFISLILVLTSVITWLTYLYYFSYVKLFITVIKYMPQVWLNFKRKSTEGFSIGGVLLDLTGGILSITQMFMISYNYNDWASVFEDPTKFGLGIVSIFFDVILIVQHYICYRNRMPLTGVHLQQGDTVPILYNQDI